MRTIINNQKKERELLSAWDDDLVWESLQLVYPDLALVKIWADF